MIRRLMVVVLVLVQFGKKNPKDRSFYTSAIPILWRLSFSYCFRIVEALDFGPFFV